MIRLPNRLHSSSPALNGNNDFLQKENVGINKKRIKENDENDFLANFISTLYCKVIVLLGVALPITDAITLNRGIYSFRIFYIYLYTGCIFFLSYMCFVQIREKNLKKSLNEYHTRSFFTERLVIKHDTERINQPVRYGSFYLRMGVTAFGMGSVIYAGFQLIQYFEYSFGNHCAHVLKAVKPFLRIIFVLMQIFFILSTNNFVHVQKSKMIARFGLMHMIATNICEWFQVVVKETQHDIYKTAKDLLKKNDTIFEENSRFSNFSLLLQTKRFYEEKDQCLSTNIVGPLLSKTEPYLAPCTIEYSVLCAVILGLIWKKNLTYNGRGIERTVSNDAYGNASGYNVIYSRTKSRFSVDCSRAHKGLFIGILVFIITIMILILCSELQMHEKYRYVGLQLVSIWEFLLFWMGTLASLLCILSIRDVGYYKTNRDLELEHLLLLLSQSGIFIYNLFQIMGAIHMGSGLNGNELGKLMRIITPISCLVQSSVQTALVLIAWRRRCITKTHIREKPGKQLVTFLLLSNFANWIISRFNHNSSISHPTQLDFFGFLAWNIITHVSIPLVLTYRFQSTVCFYEIWTHVYKTTAIGTSCRDFNDDEDRFD